MGVGSFFRFVEAKHYESCAKCFCLIAFTSTAMRQEIIGTAALLIPTVPTSMQYSKRNDKVSLVNCKLSLVSKDCLCKLCVTQNLIVIVQTWK